MKIKVSTFISISILLAVSVFSCRQREDLAKQKTVEIQQSGGMSRYYYGSAAGICGMDCGSHLDGSNRKACPSRLLDETVIVSMLENEDDKKNWQALRNMITDPSSRITTTSDTSIRKLSILFSALDSAYKASEGKSCDKATMEDFAKTSDELMLAMRGLKIGDKVRAEFTIGGEKFLYPMGPATLQHVSRDSQGKQFANIRVKTGTWSNEFKDMEFSLDSLVSIVDCNIVDKSLNEGKTISGDFFDRKLKEKAKPSLKGKLFVQYCGKQSDGTLSVCAYEVSGFRVDSSCELYTVGP